MFNNLLLLHLFLHLLTNRNNQILIKIYLTFISSSTYQQKPSNSYQDLFNIYFFIYSPTEAIKFLSRFIQHLSLHLLTNRNHQILIKIYLTFISSSTHQQKPSNSYQDLFNIYLFIYSPTEAIKFLSRFIQHLSLHLLTNRNHQILIRIYLTFISSSTHQQKPSNSYQDLFNIYLFIYSPTETAKFLSRFIQHLSLHLLTNRNHQILIKIYSTFISSSTHQQKPSNSYQDLFNIYFFIYSSTEINTMVNLDHKHT